MNLHSVASVLSFLSWAGCGTFVFLKAKHSADAKQFSLVAVWAGLWTLFPFFLAIAPSEHLALLGGRLAYIGGILIPPSLLHFSLTTTGLGANRINARLLRLFYLFGVLLISVLPSVDFFGSVTRFAPHFVVVPGTIYHSFVAYWLGVSTYAFVVLVAGFLHTHDLRRRNQLKYFFLAFFIGFIQVLIHFAATYFKSEPIPHDILGVFFPIIIAYAIVRHQLLEIEVIIRRTLQFAGLVGFAVLLMAIIPKYMLQLFGIPRTVTDILGAVIVAASFGKVRELLINVTDRYLFQKKYDYKELLKKFTDEVMLKVDLKQLVETTVNTLAETVKLEGCSLLLLDKDRRTYELVATKGANGQQVSLGEQEQLVTFLRETHEPVWLDGKVDYPQTIKGQMTLQLKARLALPLHVHEDLIGVLLLRKKKSDEVFAKDDLDILTPLARTLAIAVTNAQLFEELAKTQAEAAQKEKLAVIGTLSAGINHEICNPLGIVKAQCEAFLLDSEDGILIGKSSQDLLERTSNIMRVALKQIDRATAITQKLSNFAKPIKDPTAQTVSIEQEIDEVLILVGHDLKLEKIDVVKEIEPGLPQIVADRRQLQEVLFNLVRNAGQAIKPPGTIWVRAKASDSLVRVEITDTGSGISEENLKKIYNPFFTTKEPGKGTGLGLFIVRQIVERNKGRIGVESIVGKGTTFSLEFPAAKASPQVAAAR